MKNLVYILLLTTVVGLTNCSDDTTKNPFDTPAALKRIEYVSTDGQIITPTSPNGFGARILSNKYNGELGTIEFESAVTAIGYRAFTNCTTLRGIIIPEKVRDIEEYSFLGCNNLVEVNIPKNVTEIGDGAFAYCDNLAAFYGKFSSEDNRCLVVNLSVDAFAPAGLTSYTIPYGVREIGGSCFEGCKELTSISLPSTINEIDDRAFAYCLMLESITIPAGVTEISTSTFEGCSALNNVILPGTINEIDALAFRNCNTLQNIYCAATTPPRIAANSFENIAASAVIYVPINSVTTYQNAANWSAYASQIVGYEF